MGMYTELVLAAELKRDVPQQVIDTLAYMVGQSSDPFTPPLHPLFSAGRWPHMLTCDSYYFAGDSHSTFRFDETSIAWVLTVRSNFKNYDDEVDLFLDWLRPYVEDRGFLGYHRYEEDRHPVLVYAGASE